MLVNERGRLAKWIVIGIIVGLGFIIFVAYCVVTPRVSRLDRRPSYTDVRIEWSADSVSSSAARVRSATSSARANPARTRARPA